MITEQKILDNIILFRQQKGFSQSYVAERLGMKQAGYSLIENNERGLTVVMLLQIVKILEADLIELLQFPEMNNNSMERISVTFEVSPDKRDYLLKLVTGEK